MPILISPPPPQAQWDLLVFFLEGGPSNAINMISETSCLKSFRGYHENQGVSETDPDYYQQPGGMTQRQLTTAAENTWIAYLANKQLLPFVPLWSV